MFLSLKKSSWSSPLFGSSLPFECSARTDEDDATQRPAKRIKVETSDSVSEADVGNLKNPHLNSTNNTQKKSQSDWYGVKLGYHR